MANDMPSPSKKLKKHHYLVYNPVGRIPTLINGDGSSKVDDSQSANTAEMLGFCQGTPP
jgi:hypothetical protein